MDKRKFPAEISQIFLPLRSRKTSFIPDVQFFGAK